MISSIYKMPRYMGLCTNISISVFLQSFLRTFSYSNSNTIIQTQLSNPVLLHCFFAFCVGDIHFPDYWIPIQSGYIACQFNFLRFWVCHYGCFIFFIDSLYFCEKCFYSFAFGHIIWVSRLLASSSQRHLISLLLSGTVAIVALLELILIFLMHCWVSS